MDYSVYEEQIRKLVDKQVIGTEVREAEGVYLVHQLGQAEKPEDWSEEKTPQRDGHDPDPAAEDHRARTG